MLPSRTYQFVQLQHAREQQETRSSLAISFLSARNSAGSFFVVFVLPST